jgi:ribosomal protein S18 acetylase RimI-like enzyme
MAGLPAGFTLRPPLDADAETIAAMINAETTALRGFAVVSVEWVLTPWSAPGTDREHDFAVLVDPGGDVGGYLQVESDPPHTEVFSIGVVALHHHGRGLGAAVVAECERRAQRFVALAGPGVRVVMHAGSLAEEPRVAGLLRAHGYTEVRRFTAMRIDFAETPAGPEPVAGIEIRGLRPGEERAVYACLAEAFADHWGETWPTEQAWMHHHVAATDADPGLWQLAWHGSELAGALVAEPRSGEDPAVGYVAALGVRRAYRRRGIAGALLRTSFRQLHARGAAGVSLHVDTQSTTGATRVYERAGMTAEPRFAAWEKELRAATGPAAGL